MNEKKINEHDPSELLIDKKIAEAKLEVAEKRLQYTLTAVAFIFGMFGVLLPLLLSSKMADRVDNAISDMRNQLSQSQNNLRSDYQFATQQFDEKNKSIKSDVQSNIDSQTKQNIEANNKIDKAIQNMEAKFKELAGNQLRKSDLECLYDEKTLNDIDISFPWSERHRSFVIKNIGDATAKNIRVRLYMSDGIEMNNYDESAIVQSNERTNWEDINSDDKLFKKVYETHFQSMDPKETNSFYVNFLENQNNTLENHEVLLKILHEGSEPKIYRFKIKIIK